ncbi:MAG: hypothetical protein DRP16_04555, partial [Candidatus Aenigmatarchaeota archaeon]
DTATYTFDSADNGSATFSITDTTQETIDIDVSGSGKTDDDSEGNLVVGEPVIAYFVISHDGSASAGVAEDVTVTAKDSLGNTMTNYTGQITLDTNGTANTISWALKTGSGTFNDGGAGTDTAIYTYSASDNGVVVFTITDNTQETINISVTGDSKSDDNSEGNLIVGAPVLDHFLISHDGSAVAGVAENVTVTIKDSIGNTKTDYIGQITLDTDGTTNAISWSLVSGSGTFTDGGASSDTATYTFDSADNGSATFSITDTKAETINISVSGDGKTDDDSEGDLVVSFGGIDHFVVSHDGSALINIAEPVTITAKDAYENTITDYTGTITVDTDGTPSTISWALQSGQGTFTDGGSGVDTCTYTYSSSDNGTVTLNITNSSTEAVDIDVSGSGKTDDDSEGYLDFASPSDIIVDNEDGSPTYTDGGSDWSTRTGGTHYGDNWRRHDGDNEGAWAKWRPDIPTTGNYEVYTMGRSPISWLATQAPFTVYYDGGSQTTYIDQSLNGNPNWQYLGTFRFVAGTSGYVELTDTNAGGTLSADVCKWVLKGIASATANPVTTSSVEVGSSGNLILDITVTNQHSVDDTVSSITVNNTGTAQDSEISSVKLYYDSNNSDDYTPGVDTQIGSGTFSGGQKVFSGLSVPVAASGGSERFFVVLDISSSATDGHTLDVEIPVDGIVMTNAGKVNRSALNSSGTRELNVVLDHFVISHDSSALAGSDENITITAKDAYENTVTDYTGTITVDTNGTASAITWALNTGSGSFTDGGAGTDTATYTFSTADNGVVVLALNDTKAETINISVAGSGKTDDDTEGDLVVSPAPLDHFVISHDGTATAGVAESITVIAQDLYANIITDYSGEIVLDTNGTANAISWALTSGFGTFTDGGGGSDTASYTFSPSDNGEATFAITDNIAETINISVSGDGKTDDDSEGNLVVSPASLDHFVISHDGSASAGVAENITITAKDALGNTKTDYTGQITLDTNGTATTISWSLVSGSGTFTDGGANSDTATYTFDSADNGSATFSLTDTKTETLNISVSGDGKTDDDTEGDLVVNPGAIDHFTISHDGTGITGVAEDVDVVCYDAQGNVKTDYTGTITLDTNGTPTAISWTLKSGSGTFTDGGANSDTASYTFSSADSGQATFGIVDFTAETVNISISGDGKTDDDTEGNLQFISSGIDHFLISHDGNAISGVAENITIYAKDANGDTLTNYQGQITIDTNGTATTISWSLVSGSGTFSDGGANSDTATYTFDSSDNGVVVLSITDTVEETINISVSGEGKSDDDTEGNLVINPAGLHHFSLSHDGIATAGVAESITITAKDANNSTITDYTGQITLDTNGTATTISWAKQTGNGAFSDGGPASDTATYTFVSSDNGQCILTLTDTKVETINISVSGSGKSDDDTEGNLAIGPGEINHFVITHDGSAEAGVADNITIRAYDAYSNLKTDYTGTITVDTNGTASAITWAKVSGNGTFSDGGPS